MSYIMEVGSWDTNLFMPVVHKYTILLVLPLGKTLLNSFPRGIKFLFLEDDIVNIHISEKSFEMSFCLKSYFKGH